MGRACDDTMFLPLHISPFSLTFIQIVGDKFELMHIERYSCMLSAIKHNKLQVYSAQYIRLQ